MELDPTFYLVHLYPFQNSLLKIINKLELSISKAITDAQSKAAGIFPVTLAQVLIEVRPADWEQVVWQEAPDVDSYLRDLRLLGESLILKDDG
jgi:hypothetical protein